LRVFKGVLSGFFLLSNKRKTKERVGNGERLGGTDVSRSDSDDGFGDEAEVEDVEETSSDFDGDSGPIIVKDMSARRRLEELLEEQRAAREIEDFEDYDF
jgi:hypothetical protein